MFESDVIHEEPIHFILNSDIGTTIEERVRVAREAIRAIFVKGHPCIAAYSGGKDSGVLSSLVLDTARDLVPDGFSPLVVVTTSDTGVENPEITSHFRAELAKMQSFGQKHGFTVITKVVRPTLLASFQLKVLTGRGLPSFPGGQSDCTVDLKTSPQRSFRKKLLKDLADKYPLESVTFVGTRFDESARRAGLMKARGDQADLPTRNKDGDLVLSPIAYWSTDDVWEYIGMVGAGIWPTYTDFEETRRLYADGGGTSCAVVSDAIMEQAGKKAKGGCGARFGCFVCQKSEDKSLATMIEFDPRYAYARGLNRFNQYLRNTQYDWSLRHWIGRTIKGGYIAIQPDTYHPKMIRTLTRFMLQLDFDEMKLARREGRERKFELLPEPTILALDAMQSLNGVARPYQTWADRRDIFERGVRYDIPTVERTPKTPLPSAKYLYLGSDWDSTAPEADWTGLRDPMIEALTEGSACAPEVVVLGNGKTTWSVDTEKSFSVDPESAYLFADFELETVLKDFDNLPTTGVLAAYRHYRSMGILTLSHSQQSEHEMVARRTAHKERLGLGLDYKVENLLAKSVEFSEMTPEGQAAWGKKK